MGPDGLCDLLSHAHNWIKRSHWFLKDHRDLRASKLAHVLGIKLKQILLGPIPSEQDFSADIRLGGQQAHDGERSDGLS